ncbi:cation:proton antiporter [Pontibacter sp. KCTC 32443]|uniref:cation:proton antiporter domain-containing protein n=1 Tax=Pontibacter TaxID=323449 RepID=UPI00164E84AF|nr:MULTISPECIES: cation:proton antiporter [Pontibacter]MBC5773513.1 cation:proton antiporter [Pontibacter sp. KCTC 32443]
MDLPILEDVVIILGLAVVVILLFQRLKLPTILGFLITGVIAGPYGFSLINDIHNIEMLAEIGVILLLFIIGIEFSLRRLALIKRTILVGGAMQVFGSIVLIAAIMRMVNDTFGESVFVGFLIALSSTAIVLKLLQDKGEIYSPHGKVALGILIFQDIVVVPMMLLAPLLTGKVDDVGFQLLLMLLKGLLVIAVVLISARYFVPRLLYMVAQTKSKELFILSIIAICFIVAWLTSSLGLSLALGAFMAGLIISESEYSYQATSNILPFREIFTSFFFVSIGMLLDFNFLLRHLPLIVVFTFFTFLIKALVATFAARILQYPLRTAILTGISLFQVGEFAFILSKAGITYGLLTPTTYQYFLSVSLLTMALTPFVFQYAQRIASFVSLKLVGKHEAIPFETLNQQTNDDLPELDDHIVIIGFGINGRNVAKAARYAHIPYTIIEMNAVTVKKERQHGEPILFGDAVHAMILSHVNVHKARVVVIAISDPDATKRIIAAIRQISDKVHIIVRTRFVEEMKENFMVGADEVIPEEFETSIEIFTRVLSKYLMPRDEIERFTQQIRSDNYDMLRSMQGSGGVISNLSADLPDIEVASLRVFTNDASIINLPLSEINLRLRFGITIVAIKREGNTILDINAKTILKQGDIVYVVGKPDDVFRFGNFLKAE